MKILWVVNVKLPVIYELTNEQNQINAGGWLDRISKGVLNNPQNELMVCYPHKANEEGKVKNLSFRGINYGYREMRLGAVSDEKGVSTAKGIIKEFQPDVIHIHGTEYQYHWFFAKAADELGMKNRTVTSIQGLVGVYAKHFALGLPFDVVRWCTIKEFLQRNNINNGMKNFRRRGVYENRTIMLSANVLGRTSWDRACTLIVNPDAKYYTCNETLRELFYSGEWSYDSCVKHRIFISQATYPVKGFHLFLEALVDIKRFFPDVTVHVAGANVTKGGWVKGSSYGLYIRRLMRRYGVEDCICFCGNLNAEQMKSELLQANVFVSPSTIENSPNSVGEAMLLGVPVVSSGVGGVMGLMKHAEEGFIYQSDAPYMLAYYVNKVFEYKESALSLGKAAHARATLTHNYEKNLDDLINIYNRIIEENYERHISNVSQSDK